jgi:hypothetical protein
LLSAQKPFIFGVVNNRINTIHHMKKLLPVCLLLLFTAPGFTAPHAAGKEVYEIKVYRYKTSAQEKGIDDYLQYIFIPSLHKAGIAKIGVFKPLANDTAAEKVLYVFIPFKSLEQWHTLAVSRRDEPAAGAPGAAYTNAAYTDIPYTRMESIVLEAFPLATQMQLPVLNGPHEEHIYELRSYESPTEKYNDSKVRMFNAGGEIALFKRLGFNGIFYAEVLSGSHMPNLMYMTSFDNKQARDDHWKAFGNDDEWKKLKALPEYQNNVSRAEVVLCHAAPYSDL